ncbi:hypothetical protein BIU97_10285 [Curtobacterium sp. MCBA15_009]|uniref:hypothetical protein n=1 Tax=Curtobacterium sp. MCBA15_009 TaxID=1898737 RepID=UPI0008DDAACA|nr:hypothetical protein [Curtobacterium sp. MCBA15_009]OII10507.1 hypothetical protein BIU97_10285 [Curtobacterium sp. MCBA15_009]
MTHHVAVSSTLSAAAREALADFLSASRSVDEIVNPDRGWPAEATASIAQELVDAGYGTITNGTFTLDIRPVAPQQLPTDALDELSPALLLIDHIVERTNRQRSPEKPNPDNVLGTSFAVLLQLQNVLRLAVYGRQGRLNDEDVARQLPTVAIMLARAIRAEVA